ncbi:zinc finger protein 572-like [Willisornis vidua]|uniref:Zinc finger protein 572-like n=1 Tax=Willisornis vidua TaxID=1566151 RepID=A0ABQ9DYR4_9PASS|nr:zinc finger protein 572-like [Willisornis vidua]
MCRDEPPALRTSSTCGGAGAAEPPERRDGMRWDGPRAEPVPPGPAVSRAGGSTRWALEATELMEPTMESILSIFESSASSGSTEYPGGCEEEKGIPADLQQEELPQVPGALSPERGAACNDPPPQKRYSRKLVLSADGQKLCPEEKPSFKCPECGKGFKGHSRLLNHLQIHSRDKRFVCAECGKSFTRKANLVVHQRVHTGERPYKCKACEKTFSCASSLLAHHKTHLKEKPFSCTLCRRSFSGNTALLQHQRVHADEKPCRHPEGGNSSCVSPNSTRHQHLRARPNDHTADANQPEFISLHPKEEQRCGAKKCERDHLNVVSEELKKMMETMDMLLLNQRSQLQVLQEIQKQLNVLVPGNALVNSNVYGLGVLLGQQAAAAAAVSCPLLSPSRVLCENGSALSLSSDPGILPTSQLPNSQDAAASRACSVLCHERVRWKHV